MLSAITIYFCLYIIIAFIKSPLNRKTPANLYFFFAIAGFIDRTIVIISFFKYLKIGIAIISTHEYDTFCVITNLINANIS